jgi:hypothetical protein
MKTFTSNTNGTTHQSVRRPSRPLRRQGHD